MRQEKISSKRKTLSVLSFILFAAVSSVHIVLTNLEGNLFDISKVFLMPALALTLLVSARSIKTGAPILWALTGLWLGNLCLIWGEESQILFAMGSAFTIVGFFGYMFFLVLPVKSVSRLFILLQMPILWICALFIFIMQGALGGMLIPMALYMMLIAIISLAALARLLWAPKRVSSWLFLAASLFYIAENGLYTVDHYMHIAAWGENVVHPCFIAAQTLFVLGFLRSEKEQLA